VAALLGALVAPGTALAATPPWKVAVGAQSRDAAVQANFFFTNKITIHAGESVQWTSQAGEIHTVSFLAAKTRADYPLFAPAPGGGIAPNPLVFLPQGSNSYDGSAYSNSGQIAVGTSATQYELTFPTPGTYSYVCLIHSEMDGTVVVEPTNKPLPRTQQSYDVEANIARAIALGQGAATAARGIAAGAGPNKVTAGIGQLFTGLGSVAVLRFEPDRKVVRAGQTVTWSNLDPETPHTVTFGTEPPGGSLGAFAPVNLDPPPGAVPGHATIGSPTKSVNSGFIGAGLPFGTTFTATFTAAGTYSYICALHDDLGMVGTITVLP